VPRYQRRSIPSGCASALRAGQDLDATGPLSLTTETAALGDLGLVPVANPADLAALALIRAAVPAGAGHLTALSAGPAAATAVLRISLALGADAAVRIWDDAMPDSPPGPEVTARVLAAAISTLGFDLVVCGSHSLSGGSGYVGPALAEHLDYAQVCSVSHLESSPEQDMVIVHRRLDHGEREIVACRLPAVITVDDGATDIPYASLPSLVTAEEADICSLHLAGIGLTPADLVPRTAGKFLAYLPPRPRTKKSPPPEPSLSPLQAMQMAVGGGVRHPDRVIEGEAVKVAAEIIRFFVSNGILTK